MFPIGDENHEIGITPVVTWGLIGVNILAWVYELMQGPALDRFIMNWGAVPAYITSGEHLSTLITSMFLHGGWAHIFGNMLFLWVFGDNVEDRLGHGRFLIFYLVTGLLASGAHIALDPSSTIPSVGASGAISGVLGAYIVMFRSNRVRVLLGYFVVAVPAWMMIGFWAAQQFFSTWMSVVRTEQTGGIAYAAHAGGFLAGVILAFIMRNGSGNEPTERSRVFR